MEFNVKRSDLLDELNLTQGVVERKSTIPILSNLLVEAKGSRLTITATDLELSIRTSCEAKVKREGAGTIPAKKLFELIRLLPAIDSASVRSSRLTSAGRSSIEQWPPGNSTRPARFGAAAAIRLDCTSGVNRSRWLPKKGSWETRSAPAPF